jgi:hypothetical protein
MSASAHPSTHRDADVAALVRAGVAADVIYAALWPGGPAAAPMPFDSFVAVVRALEVDAVTTTPTEQLPEDLEDIVGDLLLARRKIMEAIETTSPDGDEGFDNSAHIALCKNADVVLKYQTARQERQVHLLNLRVAREKARLELLALHAEGEGAALDTTSRRN